MVRSMFAGVAGLRTHQSKMDVIGNNIANVNTWGYKAANMSFRDAMYQSTSSGSAGSTKNGGYGAINGNQIGYGVTTGSISYDFDTGAVSPSSRGLDCMIEGSGFFLVGPMLTEGNISLDTDDAVKSSGLYLSRVGKFEVDPNGYLVDDSGNYVYGFKNNEYAGDPNFGTESLVALKLPTNAEMEQLTKKKGSEGVGAAKAKYEAALAAATAASLAVGNARQALFDAQTVYDGALTTNKIGDFTTARDKALKEMEQAYSEYKNNTEGTPAEIAARKKDYTDKKLVYDKAEFDLTVAQSKINLKEESKDYPEATLTKIIGDYEAAYNALQAAVPGTEAYETANKTLTDAQNAMKDAMKALSVTEPGSIQDKLTAAKLAVKSADAKLSAANDLVKTEKGNLTQAENANAEKQENSAKKPDERAAFTNYKIQGDGTIVGTADDNSMIVIGKIALGSVSNPGGLEKESGYYYSVGASAGNVSVFEPGGVQGKIKGNALEMAKVDLATEMTDMITTQRGFQANSKIITVTDQMLEELVNMKR